MSQQHQLLGRTEDEVLWFQRRSFLSAAAAWTAMGGFDAAVAQQRSNIVELTGDAMLNGKKLLPSMAIQTGDSIETGPKSNLIFVVGNASFQLRQNSNLKVERGSTINAVSVLRLLTGAVGSVWGKGGNRQIITPTLTAGIRGTGVYTEIFKERNNRNYFCNCYGVVDIAAGGENQTITAQYHQAVWADTMPDGGMRLTAAKAINHTDEEQEFLARLINQKTAWQISGVKSNKDGKGGY